MVYQSKSGERFLKSREEFAMSVGGNHPKGDCVSTMNTSRDGKKCQTKSARSTFAGFFVGCAIITILVGESVSKKLRMLSTTLGLMPKDFKI
jgi:hypothetical protein